jgi:hypothetical protein
MSGSKDTRKPPDLQPKVHFPYRWTARRFGLVSLLIGVIGLVLNSALLVGMHRDYPALWVLSPAVIGSGLVFVLLPAELARLDGDNKGIVPKLVGLLILVGFLAGAAVGGWIAYDPVAVMRRFGLL